ncbi:MAG: preprotein translocase subunit SecY [Clostridia bacterium]|nr:preprotein translocase subunit SecY [Clostridia bacterium]
MFRTIIDAFKVKEIRKKILLTLLFLFIYRVGCWIPCIGLDKSFMLGDLKTAESLGFFELMNMMSGGALSQGSILALGVSPYITSSIVIQLLAVAIPSLQRLTKSGEEGRRKINLYTRIVALVLAVAQSIGIVVGYASQGVLDANLTSFMPDWIVGAGVVITMVAGSMFTVWLGERITDLGIGNGSSLLIFVGILSTASKSIFEIIRAAFKNPVYIWYIVIFIAVLVLIFSFIVWMDGGERKVHIQYAKQIRGRKIYGGQSNHIPIKVNATGVMPIILASTLLTFPQLIISIFWPTSTWYSTYLGTNSWLYIVLTAVFILLFAFFYSKITFDPDDVAKRIQQQGGFLQGIRPGKQTAEHLGKISNRITIFGAILLAIIALIPSLAFKGIGLVAGTGTDAVAVSSMLINAFSVTGLMIAVSVALELEKQLSAQMFMRNHKGFLN